MKLILLIACGVVFLSTLSLSAPIFSEDFNDDGWENRWVLSTEWKSEDEIGEWKHTTGKYFHDESDKGIKTGEDAKHYGISAAFDEPFNNEGKDFVVQFSVKHEQGIDCGGAYIKLLAGDFDQKSFGGDTPYGLMFGPDICGGTKRTHAIFGYHGKNLEKTSEVRCESDEEIHLYTMIVKADNTYEIQIDGKKKASGDLKDDWKFLEPKEIKDPSESKPSDWVDEREIDDPEDVKPEGYDDIPEVIPDPDAERPDDWDDEDDGEWEAPEIDNPEYKGPWSPKRIPNPDYKGEWVHPMIPNPDYKDDDSVYHACNPCGGVGFELWQVKAGTVFDDILVTTDLDEAKEAAKAFKKKQKGQKEAEEAAKEEEEEEEEESDDDLEAELHDEL